MTVHLENTKQYLIEKMADLLDVIEGDERLYGYKEDVPREQSQLHIRMAEAAFNEYQKSVKSITNPLTPKQ